MRVLGRASVKFATSLLGNGYFHPLHRLSLTASVVTVSKLTLLEISHPDLYINFPCLMREGGVRAHHLTLLARTDF